MSFGKKIGILFASIIAGSILLNILAVLLIYFLIDLPILDALQTKDGLLISQVFASIGLFASPYITYKFIAKDDISLSTEVFNPKLFVFAIVLWLAFMPLVTSLSEINMMIDWGFLGSFGTYLLDQAYQIEELTKTLLMTDNFADLLVILFVTAVLPGIVEELFFRAIIQKYILSKYINIHLAIVISSVIFGLFHFNINGILPLIAMGLLLGYVYQYTGNILIPMILHFVNNSTVVFYSYFYGEEPFVSIDDLPSNPDYLSLAISLVLSIIVMFFYIQVCKKAYQK